MPTAGIRAALMQAGLRERMYNHGKVERPKHGADVGDGEDEPFAGKHMREMRPRSFQAAPGRSCTARLPMVKDAANFCGARTSIGSVRKH